MGGRKQSHPLTQACAHACAHRHSGSTNSASFDLAADCGACSPAVPTSLCSGAHPGGQPGSVCPLFAACVAGHTEVVKALLNGVPLKRAVPLAYGTSEEKFESYRFGDATVARYHVFYTLIAVSTKPNAGSRQNQVCACVCTHTRCLEDSDAPSICMLLREEVSLLLWIHVAYRQSKCWSCAGSGSRMRMRERTRKGERQ